MISPTDLSQRFSAFLGSETEVVQGDGLLSLLTPAEYPDCDGVAVTVEPRGDEYVVSDMAAADALLDGRFGPAAVQNKAQVIVERFDVSFVGGAVLTTVTEEGLAEACWRVAQASAALAEGVSFASLERLSDFTFEERVGTVLDNAAVSVERNASLEGSSGYAHTATYFLPQTEAVVEPIAGRKAWARAKGVYAEFGDLREVNGFQLVAVVDDSLEDAAKLSDLLGQVGKVGLWSARSDWLDQVTKRVN